MALKQTILMSQTHKSQLRELAKSTRLHGQTSGIASLDLLLDELRSEKDDVRASYPVCVLVRVAASVLCLCLCLYMKLYEYLCLYLYSSYAWLASHVGRAPPRSPSRAPWRMSRCLPRPPAHPPYSLPPTPLLSPSPSVCARVPLLLQHLTHVCRVLTSPHRGPRNT